MHQYLSLWGQVSQILYLTSKACSPVPGELGLSKVLTGQGHTTSLCGNCSKAPRLPFNSTGVKTIFLFKPLLTMTLSGQYSYVPLELRPWIAQWFTQGPEVSVQYSRSKQELWGWWCWWVPLTTPKHREGSSLPQKAQLWGCFLKTLYINGQSKGPGDVWPLAEDPPSETL